MFLYNAFGIIISSELHLPDCHKIPHENRTPDIHINIGNVSQSIPSDAITFNQHAFFLPNQLWLHIKDIAWFYIEQGKFITVEPYPNADLQSIRLYLLGSGIGAIMHQRNTLIIHGNAVRIGDECIVFTGDSGAGKSTTAAAFYQKGYEFLADDLSVIHANGQVQPGIPRLKLWQDTADKLKIDTAKLSRIRLQVDKYCYPIHTNLCKTPLPIKAIYVLNKHQKNTFLVKEVTGATKLQLLQSHTYRNGFVNGLNLKAQRFRLCSQLANQAAVFNIHRPDQGFTIDQLIEIIKKSCIETA